MRVIVLSQWYTPEPDIKIHLLARDLAARGHMVTTITGFPNYPSGRIYPGYRLRWRQWEHLDGVRILRVPLYPDHSRSAAKRILNYLSFAASASVFGPILAGPADVMWVYHPPLTTGIPAWWLGLLRHVPFVYEIQDMWPETLTATGMMSSTTATAGLTHLANFVYKQASAITVISPGFKNNLIQKGVSEKKIHFIPNWADEDIYLPVPRNEELAAEHGLNARFNVMYGGNMGAAQALDNVLDAAALLRDLPDVQFILIGDGVDEARLRQRVVKEGATNVLFIGRQPMAQMPHLFALADVLLLHLKNDPLFEITIPGKTTAYMACGRPILCSVAGDAAERVLDAGAGLACPPEDPVALAETVRKFHAMPPEQRSAMGAAGRYAFLTQYTRAILVDRYETLLTEVAQRSMHRVSAGRE